MNLFRRLVASLLAASLAFAGLAQAAPSGLIGTEQLAATLAPVVDRGRLLAAVESALERQDLTAAMQARGVAVDQVRARVDALTDAEAAALLAQIDQAPAGADVLGLLFSVFVILLVTDVLGFTKVFPFTRSVR